MVWGWAAPPLPHIVPRLTKKRESRRDRLHDFSGVEKSWIYDFISMYWDNTRDAHVSKTIGITTATHSSKLGLLEHPIILSKLHDGFRLRVKVQGSFVLGFRMRVRFWGSFVLGFRLRVRVQGSFGLGFRVRIRVQGSFGSGFLMRVRVLDGFGLVRFRVSHAG